MSKNRGLIRFYNSEGVIDDYSGLNHFTSEELKKIKNNLEERKAWLEGQGIKYYVMVAPNKHTIYSEYLPSSIRKIDKETRLDQLINYLREYSNIEIIDVRETLIKNKSTHDDYLYRTNDTHWNSLGAFYAYREIVKALNKDFPSIKPMELNDFTIRKEKSGGGLSNMLALDDMILEDRIFLTPNKQRSVQDVEVNRDLYPNPPLLVVKEKMVHDDNSIKLLMFRDSFTSDMIPFLSEHFSRSVYIWDHYFAVDPIQRENPNIVIHEIVERNLHKLLLDNPDQLSDK